MGAGPDLSRFGNKIKELMGLVDSFAYGHSMLFCLKNIDTHPTYWSFVDIHASIQSLDWIINNKKCVDTELILLDPVVTTSLDIQLKYIGHPEKFRNNKKYKTYLDRITEVDDCFREITKLPTTSEQFLRQNKDSVFGNTNMNANFIERYKHHEFILGTGNDKLISFVLPWAKYNGYSTVYLIGFDGGGGRYFWKKGKKVKANIREFKESRSKYLEEWNNHLTIVSLMPEAPINKWIEFKGIGSVIKENLNNRRDRKPWPSPN